MPHPKRNPRKYRPLLHNTQQHRRPPGLKGKEIGLYYRDLNKKKKDLKKLKGKLIYLRIPQTLVNAIYESLDKIENLADQKNIYLPPVKKLNFVEPPKNLDFIPINVPESEKVLHSVTTIHKKDDDVELIATQDTEPIVISDSEDSACGTESKFKTDTPVQTEAAKVDEKMFSVSNSYVSNTPSTSAQVEYKYGYDDIITATFQEKLEECMFKGVEITIKNEETDAINVSLKQDLSNMLANNHQYKTMLKFRETLPTYKKAHYLLDVISNNQVTVISGETGCGKSTQVPQLILDDAITNGKGANIKVLVTEPRRIAASSLATRVAEERGERLGHSVGYSVRLEGVQSRSRGSIMYCTTGVLLVELEQNQALSGYSHIILDEVHERDCQIDIAMCMLKQVLHRRKDLKLILMSATIDADSLSKYYDDCPMVHIEGLAYPVKDVYMEEILEMTNFKLNYRQNFQDYKPKVWHKHTSRGKSMTAAMEKEMQYKAAIDPWLQTLKGKINQNVLTTLQDFRIEDLNINLILELLIVICRGEPGAVLVFLPGINEISKLMSMMRENVEFPASTHNICALHSKLPTVDQNMIFTKPPSNVRKIILATNIAETSITIDDVVYVVDCGKMKYKGLNVEENVVTLQNEWISKANLRQRRGRAGRCQPGICYHLVTSYRASILPDRLLPELQRSNLLEDVLTMKRLRLGKVEAALNMMPAVPAEKTILSAITHLQHVGALDEDETLTPLGWHLARLPAHPAAGKLLLLGALFGCLDRAASVAAVWGFKDPFQLVIGKEDLVDQSKREFAMGEPSDHIAMSEAIMQWEECDISNRRSFSYHRFLSHKTMELLCDMKQQFAYNLSQMGFLKEADIRSPWENRNMNNLSLFKAIVAASLYPNIASVKWINLYCRNPNKPMRVKVATPEDGKVELHPSSVMSNKPKKGGQSSANYNPIAQNPGANWLVYWLKQKSSELFLLEVTCVYTLPLLFFGALNFTKADNPDDCMISISSMKVCCRKETAQLLYQLRSLLDLVLASKISHNSQYDQMAKRKDFDNEVLGAVIDLITAEDEGAQYMDDDDEDSYYNYEQVPSDTALLGGEDDSD